MSSRRPGTLLSGAVLFGLVFLNLHPIASLPAPGLLLDPVRGIWSVTHSAELPDSARGAIPGLRHPVEVHYDRRGVPHLFAQQELDAVRALGYVVARDRLFQMEIQSRAGAGTLAELVGAAALPLDREIRRLGLPDGARRSLNGLEAGERELLQAFSDGANAWMATGEVPLEYHLLGRRPAPWAPLNTLNLISRMGYVLALSDLEETVERARLLLGPAVADALYPRNNPIQEPVQPNGERAPRVSTESVPAPPEVAARRLGGSARDRLAAEPRSRVAAEPVAAQSPRRRAGDALGSNNWAVAPGRTAGGHALLAGDQHLELTLPAIWYEAHLSVADSLDVYGVTIPGAPGIIIGFNRAVAWTFTNTEADVLDLYRETVDDSLAPTRYLLDSVWQPVRVEYETYRGARGERIGRDTLRYTHRGPLRHNPVGGGWVSMRWTMLEMPSPPSVFGRAARDSSVTSWLATMSGYQAPAQNMLVVDTTGSIAIRANGRFPLRPTDRGDLIQPGQSRTDDWTGEWSLQRLPQALNPAQGFLSSANQQPVDPRIDGRYLGANWYSPWRALRINQLLRADSSMTPEGMRRIQVDPGSALADVFVPALLNAASKFPERDTLRRAALLLAEWDRRYTVENSRAVLFEEALSQVQLLLWDELHRPGSTLPDDPALAVTAQLLRDSTSAWWDDRRTRAVVEQRDDLLALGLVRALSATISSFGEPTGNNWRWDRIRTTNVRHLLRLPALSALGIANAGGMGTINPVTGQGNFGSSWRMIVEAGPEMHGWGAYPGGQSGNPLSSRYLDRMRSWRAGELDSLRFPHRPSELDGERISLLYLAPVSVR